MPNVVLKKPFLENEFNRNGFIKTPFLSTEQTDYLKKIFSETLPEKKSPVKPVATETGVTDTNEPALQEAINDARKKTVAIITDAFQKKTDEYLNDYVPVAASYTLKAEHAEGVAVQQNKIFVDEEDYTSVCIWVALTDSTEKNGTLQLVTGSHKRFGKLRGPMIPWELEAVKSMISKHHLTAIPLKAGEAVIFDSSMIRAGSANQTAEPGLSIQMMMIPAAAQTDRTHDKTNADTFETDPELYMDFHGGLKPGSKKELNTEPYSAVAFTYYDFLKVLKGDRFDVKKTFRQKVAGFFKS